MTAPSDVALDGRRAVAVLWAGLRLVVVDVETTTSDDGHRVVSMAAVTCRNGRVGGSWQTLVNPGVPVTRATTRVHGLTDEHLVGEPPFPALAPMLVPLLTPVDGERLVVVAHKVTFDVPVLRAELDRAGLAMPDAPVLDTMGRLPSIVGVQPADRSLAALLDTLGLANAKPHDALADATATAQAVVALLNRAAGAGLLDFDALLADASDGATTLTVTLSAPGRRSRSGAPPLALPSEHVAGHATCCRPDRASGRSRPGGPPSPSARRCAARTWPTAPPRPKLHPRPCSTSCTPRWTRASPPATSPGPPLCLARSHRC